MGEGALEFNGLSDIAIDGYLNGIEECVATLVIVGAAVVDRNLHVVIHGVSSGSGFLGPEGYLVGLALCQGERYRMAGAEVGCRLFNEGQCGNGVAILVKHTIDKLIDGGAVTDSTGKGAIGAYLERYLGKTAVCLRDIVVVRTRVCQHQSGKHSKDSYFFHFVNNLDD